MPEPVLGRRNAVDVPGVGTQRTPPLPALVAQQQLAVIADGQLRVPAMPVRIAGHQGIHHDYPRGNWATWTSTPAVRIVAARSSNHTTAASVDRVQRRTRAPGQPATQPSPGGAELGQSPAAPAGHSSGPADNGNTDSAPPGP
jgi:hypothetical protein